MSNTPNNNIPYVPESTLDPAAGLNDSLRVIDGVLNVRVINMSTSAPPANPGDGDRYIVASSPSGVWAGHTNDLAQYVEEGDFWNFYEPGTLGFVLDESTDPLLSYVWDGSEWKQTGATGPKGDQGDQGDQGDPGTPGTNRLIANAEVDSAGGVDIDCSAAQIYVIPRDTDLALTLSGLPPAGTVYDVELRLAAPEPASEPPGVLWPAGGLWPLGWVPQLSDGTDGTAYDVVLLSVSSDGSWLGYPVEGMQEAAS